MSSLLYSYHDLFFCGGTMGACRQLFLYSISLLIFVHFPQTQPTLVWITTNTNHKNRLLRELEGSSLHQLRPATFNYIMIIKSTVHSYHPGGPPRFSAKEHEPMVNFSFSLSKGLSWSISISQISLWSNSAIACSPTPLSLNSKN